MSVYMNKLKTKVYTSLREAYYQELRTSFPPLGTSQPLQLLDMSQVDMHDQQDDTEDADDDDETHDQAESLSDLPTAPPLNEAPPELPPTPPPANSRDNTQTETVPPSTPQDFPLTAPPKPIHQQGDSSDNHPETLTPNPSLPDGKDDDELNKKKQPISSHCRKRS